MKLFVGRIIFKKGWWFIVLFNMYFVYIEWCVDISYELDIYVGLIVVMVEIIFGIYFVFL